jgi:hypothetical protein
MGDAMPRIRTIAAAFLALIALIPLALFFRPSAATAEKRIALVIGNAGYQVGALATPANDAGLRFCQSASLMKRQRLAER